MEHIIKKNGARTGGEDLPRTARSHRGAEHRWLWVSLAVWVALLRGPTLVHNFRPPHEFVTDFFQEYASARNRVEGLPVYTNHLVTIPRYLGTSTERNRPLVVINAHPPTSVLLAIPFARLDFDRAFFWWNVSSLVLFASSGLLILRQLGVPITEWPVAPAVVLVMFSDPFLEQIHLGQLNMVLLLLVTGAWAAERSGRPWSAGVLLGAAAAVKIFPGFLLVYFAIRGRWRVVVGGAISAVALTALTAAVLGPGTYVAYVRDVLPQVHWFRVGWNNTSLAGFWSRLFDPAPERLRNASRTVPLWYSPALAHAATAASDLAVVAVVAWAARRVRTRSGEDLAFGLVMTAMLLVSPITWEHYFLLLLPPLAVRLADPPPSAPERAVLAAALACLWVSPALVWSVAGLGGRVARPVDSLTVLAVHTYALLGLLLLGVVGLRRESPHSPRHR